MTDGDLQSVYRRYLACLNERRLDDLHLFVGLDVVYNGERVGLSGYRQMLANDFRDVPDVHFSIGLLVADDTRVACRLDFRCTPRTEWLGAGDGRTTVTFAEHVFYEFAVGKIVQVWSLVDREKAREQLRRG